MSTQSPWAGFSTDPRGRSGRRLRASDRDRDHAASILANAYAEGRLRTEEHSQRLDAALAAEHLGDLVPIITDLVVPAPAAPRATPSRFRRKGELAPDASGWRRKSLAARTASQNPGPRMVAVALPLLVAAASVAFLVFGHFPFWLLLILPVLFAASAVRRAKDRSPGPGGTNQLPNPNRDDL
ncbi:hypothetical protein GCM10028820_31800 [Tessaracoccus terricola]